MISNRRRRGQGMTEYIMLVGLIGILLITAVTRFKDQIQWTIEGSAGAVNDMNLGGTNANPNLGGTTSGPSGTYSPTGTVRNGEEIYTNGGREYVKRGNDYVPAPPR